MFNPSSPVTGATVAGFTSPTYTLSVDQAPAVNAKQYTVSALGGTQTGVDVHTVSKPFTVTMFKPQQARGLPQANPVTGIIKNIPINTYKIIVRKGVMPAANQAPIPAEINLSIKVPAGADTYDQASLKALISAAFGVTWQQASGVGDTINTGTM